MDYNKQLSLVVPGDQIEGFYILKSAASRITNSGKPYLSATLSDRSGSADAKVWDYSGPVDASCEGSIVKVRADVQDFKGTKQLTVSKIRLANINDSVDLDSLVPVAPIDDVSELDYVKETVSSIEDEQYRSICETMLERHLSSFSKMPAGKTVHHAFIHGLLMHTANMLRIADFLSSNIYPDAVDRSLLLAGTLLHDFAKETEYDVSEFGMITEITTEGALLGHLVMGAEEVGNVGAELGIDSEKIMLLKHMILAHHGEPEFGAAVVPCIAESELLSYIDLLDSRMEIYAETFENLDKGKFSDRIWSLDKKIYNHN